MKSRSTITPMGALHPILFFAGVYVVALLMSIFICSSIFYSINGNGGNDEAVAKKTEKSVDQAVVATDKTSIASLH